ncbi:14733_t:CDS:1, partial [Dentiscutata erythropus]
MEDSGSSTVNLLLETETLSHFTYVNKKNKREHSKNPLWSNHLQKFINKKVVIK